MLELIGALIVAWVVVAYVLPIVGLVIFALFCEATKDNTEEKR